MSVFVERTQTAEDHLVSLWELLEEESIIAHKLTCSCDRHNFFVNFCTGCRCRNPGARFSLCSVLAFFLGCPSGSSMRNYVIDSAIVIFEKQCLQTISFNLDLNLNFRSEDRIGGFPQRVRG